MPRRSRSRSRYRSRSRSSHRRSCRDDYDYATYYYESSEEECDRGRSPFQLLKLLRPRSQSATRVIVNNMVDNYFGRERSFENSSYIENRGWSRYYTTECCGGHHRPNNQCNYQHGNQYNIQYNHKPHCCGHDVEEYEKKEREKAAQKAAEDEARKIQKEKEDLDRRMKALEQRNRARRMLGNRDLLTIDLELASCNAGIANLDGVRHQMRRTRSFSRPGVRLPGHEVLESYPDY